MLTYKSIGTHILSKTQIGSPHIQKIFLYKIMSDKLMEKYSEEYSEFLGREWGGQRGAGCFNLLFEFGRKTGYHECAEDYSLTFKDFLRNIWELEGWTSVLESEEGDDFDKTIIEKYDVLVMSFDNLEPNRRAGRLKHSAIHLGDGIILHQKAYDVSRLEYVDSYIPYIRHILRKNE
jgi:hypothetical protein